MDRETQAKAARAFREEMQTVFNRYSELDFDLSLTPDDTLDPTDYLDIYRAAFIYARIEKAVYDSRLAARDRQVEIDSQVITRADLRRWLEGK